MKCTAPLNGGQTEIRDLSNLYFKKNQNDEHGKMIESLHEDMMLQLSRNKALEEESWCRLVSSMHIDIVSQHAH